MFFDSKTTSKHIVEYKPDDAYAALLGAFKYFDNCKIKASDESLHTISAETDSSWQTWGEKMTIAVNPHGEAASEIVITSALKRGLFDWGRNQKNIDKLIDLLSYELPKYKKRGKKK